ncbi:unnamed protein product, partial [Ixodes hexagonus]
MSVDHDSQKGRLVLEDEPGFWHFVEVAHMSSPPPSTLVAVRADWNSSEGELRVLAHALTVFLQDNLLDGVAFFSDADTASIARVTKVVSDHFQRTAKADFKIMLGVPLRNETELSEISRFSDFVVVAPHLFANQAACTVMAPSEKPLRDEDYAVLVRPSPIIPPLSAQACPRDDLKTVTDKEWLVSYRHNGSTVEMFEDEDTLELKVVQLSAGHPDGCLAAFSVDLEDFSGSCREFRRAFSRLQLLSDRLRASHGTLVCVMDSVPKEVFPVELCTYVIYNAVTFNPTLNSVVPSNGEELLTFLSMTRNSPAIAAVALDPSNLDEAGTSSKPTLKKRVAALRTWLREESLQALALFSATHADPESYGRLVEALWKLLKKTTGSRIGLIAGVHFDYSRATHVVNRLSRISDVVILLSHRASEAPSCTVEGPSEFVFGAGHYRFMVKLSCHVEPSLQRSVGESSKGEVCMSVNLGVNCFRVRSSRAELGQSCLQRQLVGYGQVGALSRVYPAGCVAAVQLDLEDWSGECGPLPPFSRLRKLASLLRDPAKGTSQRRGRKGLEVGWLKRPLVCVFTDEKPLPTTFPWSLCTYLLYMGINYDPGEAGIVEGGFMESFLQAFDDQSPLLIGGLTPGALSVVDIRDSGLLDQFLQRLSSWIKRRNLAGVALISSLMTDMANFQGLALSNFSITSAAVPCISFSMPVDSYELTSAESSFGSTCLHSKWVKYDRTCPRQGLKMERDADWMTAYVKIGSEMLVFEDEESIDRKLDSFLRLVPRGGAAAFNVPYEDFAGRCATRRRYSRLQLMSDKLKARPEEVRKKKVNTTTEQPLVCITLSEVPNPVLIGHLCSHVVYWGVVYNAEGGEFEAEERSWETFMSIEKAKLLIGLEPESTNAVDVRNSGVVAKMTKHILDWTEKKDIAGIALFSTAATNIKKLLYIITTCPDSRVHYKRMATGLSTWNNDTAMRTFESEDSVQSLVSRFLRIHWAGCVSLFGADKDDLDGQCSERGTAPRIRMVSRMLSGAPGGSPSNS